MLSDGFFLKTGLCYLRGVAIRAMLYNLSFLWYCVCPQYTNYEEVTDFYKVQSMRGTYFASRMNSGECMYFEHRHV